MTPDFLSDEDMEKLSRTPAQAPAPSAPPLPTSPDQHAADFISDADMDRHVATGVASSAASPTISDAQMNAMIHPDHPIVNEMIRSAVAKGMPRDQIINLAKQNGVDDADSLGDKIDTALKWSKQHGSYNGMVDVFGPKPEVRTAPHNDVSTIAALGNGIGQGLTFGNSDEIAAGLGSVGNSIKNVFGEGTGETMGDYYTRVRDQNRDYLHDAESQHPWVYGGGQIAGAIPSALIGGAEAGGAALLGRAAIEGGLYGAGQSEAHSVGGVVKDALVNSALSAGTGGLVNRVGAAISPTVSSAVRNLLDHNVPLTVGQMMQGNGGLGAFVGRNLEDAAKSVGPISTLATGAAERRANVGLNRGIVDEALDRSHPDQSVARSFEGKDPTQILPRAAQEAGNLNDQAMAQAQAILDARSRGLNATPLRPDLSGRATDAVNTVDFLRGVKGAAQGQATASDLVSGLRARSIDGSMNPDTYAGDLPSRVTGLIDDAKTIMGRDSAFDTIGNGLPDNVVKLAKMLTGVGGYYASGGATVPLDAAIGALYSPVGQRVAQAALTGRQGAVQKATRNILNRLSPLAGEAASINNGNGNR